MILQLFHYSAAEGILLIATRNHIFVIDLRINQVVGLQDFKRKVRSPLVKLIQCKHHPELLYCLHQNGSISSWNLNLIEFTFEYKTSWELQPFSMKNKKSTGSILTFSTGHFHNETKLILLSSNGSLPSPFSSPFSFFIFIIYNNNNNRSSPCYHYHYLYIIIITIIIIMINIVNHHKEKKKRTKERIKGRCGRGSIKWRWKKNRLE